MARRDISEVEGLRDILDFRDEYDVVLACAYEPEENGQTKFKLYDKIGEVVKGLGKRVFLPHRDLDLAEDYGKRAIILNGIVVPSSELVICYSGLPSDVAKFMVARAFNLEIPVSYLYTDESQLSKSIFFRGMVTDLIHYEDNLDNLKESLKSFYKLP